MAQPKIVLAEFDPGYLSTLERIFVREYRFSAEIVLLPNENALQRFFAEPKTIDILVIDEKLYDQTFAKHNIGNLFILTEAKPDPETSGELYNNMMHKFSTGKTIIDNVISRSGLSNATNRNAGIAKVLMLYSPVGGVGQTSLAAGVSTLIARNFRRVLYVGTDGLQTFGCVMKSGSRLQADTEKTLQQKSKYAYKAIKPMIAQELFDILPPFAAPLPSLGVTQGLLQFLLEMIKISGDYDYIVIDSGSDFNEATTGMMAFADQVLVLTAQDALSLHKLNCLLDNIDASDTNRFALVCNKYNKDSENYLQADTGRQYPSTEYIEFDAGVTPMNGEYTANLQSVQKLGQFFL